jgi:dimethylargininase
LLLINPEWVDKKSFHGTNFIEIDPGEPYSANALWVGDKVIYPNAFPKTLALLERAGIDVITLDTSELIKAEGAVTCCSLIFKSN